SGCRRCTPKSAQPVLLPVPVSACGAGAGKDARAPRHPNPDSAFLLGLPKTTLSCTNKKPGLIWAGLFNYTSITPFFRCRVSPTQRRRCRERGSGLAFDDRLDDDVHATVFGAAGCRLIAGNGF